MTTITTRAAKGSPLTFTEMDANLTNLQTAIDDHVADTVDAHDASAISADSTTLVGVGTTVQAVLEELDDAIALKADIASPTFTGDPKAPTPSNNDDDTSIATTAFVQAKSRIAPTVQTFTSGSGTYTTPANVKWIRVQMAGGGGGGSGGGTTAGNASSGGNTTFGSSLLTAYGGTGASIPGNYPGAGASIGVIASPAVGFTQGGGSGIGPDSVTTATIGGMGGLCAVLGSGIGQAIAGTAGGNGLTGCGGGGGANNGGATPGNGGGGASYVEAIIASPSSTYAYSVGAGGGGGTAGTNGFAGGAGGAGKIIVWEFY